MYEGVSVGGWTIVGPYAPGGPGAHLAANALGEEAVVRLVEVAGEAGAEELAKAAEALKEVSHPNVARLLGWGVAEIGAPEPAAPVAEPLDAVMAELGVEPPAGSEPAGVPPETEPPEDPFVPTDGSGEPAPAPIPEPTPAPATAPEPPRVPHRTVFWSAEELVGGATLQVLFGHAGGRVPVADAARWASQVCAGLSALHAHGIVVGSLRAESVVVTPEGDARITGVAPPRLGAPAATDPPEAAHFASPESARGAELHPSSDIYSLGAILYRAVTGSVPFDASTAAAVASLHASAPPEPLRRVNPQVPASFENVVLRALAKEPGSRYGSAEEMRQDLERVAAGGSIMGGPAVFAPVAQEPRRKMRWWQWTLIVLVAVMALGGVAFAGYAYLTKPVVPDVAGMTESQAAAVLAEASLVLGQVSYRAEIPSGVETGSVLGQDPPAGARVASGTVVDIVVAGAKTVPVPGVVGLSESEAITRIQQAGFSLGSVESTYGTAENVGTVVSQAPSAGVELPEGSPIGLTVSRGPELVAVPGVTGRTRADAEKLLKDAGFAVEVVEEASDTATQGVVFRQSPDAGVTATKGTKVTIHVSKGKGKVAVPNVIGLSEAEAKSDLTAAGFKPVSQYRTGTQVGKVVDQSPRKGTQVDSGSIVYITVERTGP